MGIFNLFKNNPSSSDDETLNYISKSLQNEEYEDFNANNNNEESLSKAFDKAKLVQKEVQVRGKNGQIHTRKQWVKAGEDPKADKPVKAQEEQKDSKSKMTEKNTQKVTKEEIANMTLQNYDYQKLKSYILSLPDAKTFAKDYRQIINKDVDKKYMEDKQKEESENKFVTVSFDAPKDGNSKKAIATMIAGGHSRDEIMSEAQKQGIEWKHNDHPAINWMRASVAIQKHMAGNASGNSDNTPTTESQTQQETNSNLSDATDSGLSKETRGDNSEKDNTKPNIDPKYKKAHDFLESQFSNMSTGEDEVLRILPGVGPVFLQITQNGEKLVHIDNGSSEGPRYKTDDSDLLDAIQEGFNKREVTKKLGRDEVQRRKEFIKNRNKELRKETNTIAKNILQETNKSTVVLDGKESLTKLPSGHTLVYPTDASGKPTWSKDYEVMEVFGQKKQSDYSPDFKREYKDNFSNTIKSHVENSWLDMEPHSKSYDETSLYKVKAKLNSQTIDNSKINTKLLGELDDFAHQLNREVLQDTLEDTGKPVSQRVTMSNGDVYDFTASQSSSGLTTTVNLNCTLKSSNKTISVTTDKYHAREFCSAVMFATVSGNSNKLSENSLRDMFPHGVEELEVSDIY